ncbi:unnamed protein product [Rotaria sordida]|uniref:Uncharacterized protein n=4 Tax=Rotaria sordida TaxID=392033 RepID=A0A815B0B6_9BILA|nr:unnamed protein product [Rotaria sordida]CAF1263907.1 unnamed protein product [Rotaria sordida]
MSNKDDESIEMLYSKLCLDLNMDIETKLDAWRSYEHIRKHYVLEGDQLHWLAVSLYLSCRRYKHITTNQFNPISISRLLKSANNLELFIFFDKLHKWEDMANLPDSIRCKIDQVEHAFNISSIIFEKYTKIFIEIFGGNQYKLIYSDYQYKRTSNQINPKLNIKNKLNKCSHQDLYSLIWTIYALAKTIYPSTINDLIASFHLLISSFSFIYYYAKLAKLDYLLKGCCLNELCSNDGTILDKLCLKYSCSSDICRSIIEQHFKNDLFKIVDKKEDFLSELNYLETIRDINRQYDEIVLTNCIIDERIFLEKNSQLNDLCNSLNENRYSKSSQNRTPLTANQHIKSNDLNQYLTPISQANQLIQLLYSIVQQQQTKPTNNLIYIIGQQTYLDDLVERLNECEYLFNSQYDLIENLNKYSDEENPSRSCKSRFDLSLKLFYYSIENILTIEKKRLISNKFNSEEIQQSFHKLILNNEFIRSLVGLCLLLVLYAHRDKYHDFNWILNIYSLDGYSFLKIIQIFLKTSQQIIKSRSFIKYLSSIEENILSSMAFSNKSLLWNDIQLKGILSYKTISSIQFNLTDKSLSPTNNLTSILIQSPNKTNVSRKLFQSDRSDQSTNKLTINRSKSDGIIENNDKKSIKLSPYIMFYRKLYEYVLSRLDIICSRLYGSESNKFEKIVWNLFIYLFENYTELLFRSRDLDQIILSSIYYVANSHLFQNQFYTLNEKELTWYRLIQAYKSMPNSKLKTVRSVFIRSINKDDFIENEENIDKNPCLTPSKPAGTKNLIDGNIIGDITSFYKEIFLNIPNLEKNLENNLNENQLIDLPYRNKTFENNKSEYLNINISSNIFINYSSNKIQSNLSYPQSTNKTNYFIKDKQTNSTSNVLSSSIQAGANNTVRTTRTRTEDGKFLTTISTISKINNSNDNQDNILINRNEKNLFFGQSTNNSIKRTLSDDSNSNCLTSLTKKVLQIEKDRQYIQEY